MFHITASHFPAQSNKVTSDTTWPAFPVSIKIHENGGKERERKTTEKGKRKHVFFIGFKGTAYMCAETNRTGDTSTVSVSGMSLYKRKTS